LRQLLVVQVLLLLHPAVLVRVVVAKQRLLRGGIQL
jgi:hypothetical protein